MQKSFSFLFLLSFLLTACNPSTPPPTFLPDVTPSPSINIIIPTPPYCTTIVTAPTPGPNVPSVFPPITDQDHMRGTRAPIITVMDYSDYQDPRSALFYEVVNQLLDEHPNEVQAVTRIFPLIAINDKSA